MPALFPLAQMRLRDDGSFTLRAQVKMRFSLTEIEIKPELLGHHLEIINVHFAGKLCTGMRTDRLLSSGAANSVQIHPQLKRALNDVKKFPERDPDQKQDNR